MLEGTWYNEYGSELHLREDAAGHLSGTYRTGTGRPPRPREFAVVGFAHGELVTFAVDFAEFGSVTSWAGHRVVDADGDVTLHMTWIMAVRVPHPENPAELWRATWTGADLFSRQPSEPRAVRTAPPSPLWLAGGPL